MEISFNNLDFERLQKIRTINKKYFTVDGYRIKEKRSQAKNLQKSTLNKMRGLREILLSDAYFHNRFDIKISRVTKQANIFAAGEVRGLVWLSLVPWAELSKVAGHTHTHQRLPQIQISFRQEKFVIASIWLEGNGCEQKYRDIFFDYLEKNTLAKKYLINVHKKGDEKVVFLGDYKNLILKNISLYRKDRSYSLGIERALSIAETNRLGNQIYSVISSEIQDIIENVFEPCFKIKPSKKKNLNPKFNRLKRKARKKFDIINSVRKGTEATTVTKKHQKIQKILRDHFLKLYKGTGIVTKLEEDFVDLKIEDSANNSLILYEIKTDKSPLNCIKNGLGQLLFYNLMNRKNDWNEIKLVIVGLHKMTDEAKEFVDSIKEYLGEDSFSYQQFDENKKVLLDENKS